jgi:hypothetical protein
MKRLTNNLIILLLAAMICGGGATVLFVAIHRVAVGQKSTEIEVKQFPGLARDKLPASDSCADNICGIKAVHYCSLRLGIMSSIEDLLLRHDPSQSGSSMLQLRRLCEDLGFLCSARRLSWGELLSLDSPAILWVRKNHFMCVDPRAAPTDEESVLAFEDAVGESWGRFELEAIWGGEALVITASPQQFTSRRGPRLRVENCLLYTGWCQPDSSLSLSILLRNTGSQLLTFDGPPKASCACTGVHLES